jgi:hypothetical protein
MTYDQTTYDQMTYSDGRNRFREIDFFTDFGL